MENWTGGEQPMSQTVHKGVGVLISNPEKTQFLLQQKDEKYLHCPLGYSFFGGKIEGAETAFEGLARELHEELHADSVKILNLESQTSFTKIFYGLVTAQNGIDNFYLTVYSRAVNSKELQKIAKLPVYEGKRAEVVSLEEIVSLNWIFDEFREIVEKYKME